MPWAHDPHPTTAHFAGQAPVSLIHSASASRQPRHCRSLRFCAAQPRLGVLVNPKSPNVVAPRKQPFHGRPGFVMKDGQPLMTFGNMGGSVQP